MTVVDNELGELVRGCLDLVEITQLKRSDVRTVLNGDNSLQS